MANVYFAERERSYAGRHRLQDNGKLRPNIVSFSSVNNFLKKKKNFFLKSYWWSNCHVN